VVADHWDLWAALLGSRCEGSASSHGSECSSANSTLAGAKGTTSEHCDGDLCEESGGGGENELGSRIQWLSE
jgi:hypothetical protein